MVCIVGTEEKRTASVQTKMTINPLHWIPFINHIIQEDSADRLRRLHRALILRIYPKLSTKLPQQREIALRMLAAVPSNVPEIDEEINVDAILRTARRLEAQVVRIVREIGETVVHSERPRQKLRDDLTFAYFCDKAILPLLVDIATEQPPSKNSAGEAMHGVVWSARVKAQVLRTVNFLVSGVKDKTSLYYLLSHHSVNRLVLSFLPLTQWNDPALKEMIAPYAELLKTLAVQVRNRMANLM